MSITSKRSRRARRQAEQAARAQAVARLWFSFNFAFMSLFVVGLIVCMDVLSLPKWSNTSSQLINTSTAMPSPITSVVAIEPVFFLPAQSKENKSLLVFRPVQEIKRQIKVAENCPRVALALPKDHRDFMVCGAPVLASVSPVHLVCSVLISCE